jgi:hypothetical protein
VKLLEVCDVLYVLTFFTGLLLLLLELIDEAEVCTFFSGRVYSSFTRFTFSFDLDCCLPLASPVDSTLYSPKMMDNIANIPATTDNKMFSIFIPPENYFCDYISKKIQKPV